MPRTISPAARTAPAWSSTCAPISGSGEQDAAVFAATARLCAQVGWEYQRVGELGAVHAANLRWLAGYRHPRFAEPELAARLGEVFAERGAAAGRGGRGRGPGGGAAGAVRDAVAGRAGRRSGGRWCWRCRACTRGCAARRQRGGAADERAGPPVLRPGDEIRLGGQAYTGGGPGRDLGAAGRCRRRGHGDAWPGTCSPIRVSSWSPHRRVPLAPRPALEHLPAEVGARRPVVGAAPGRGDSPGCRREPAGHGAAAGV